MSDKKLSQDEINEIIQAANSGGEQAINVLLKESDKKYDFQDYDFNRPDKFNLENIRSLDSISKAFSRNFTQIMSARLRMPIKFDISAEIEQVPYQSEYIEKMPKDTYVFCVTELGAEELGKIIVEFDLNMVIPIHKKLMGGKDVELLDERRLLTEIEQLTVEEWVNEMMFLQLQDSFRNIVDLNLNISAIETDPQYVKITTNTDMVALITFDVYLGKEEKKTTMRLCIPYLSIEPIIDQLTTENVHEFKLEKSDESKIDVLKNHLNRVEKNFDVELGKTELTLNELLDLSKDDVLLLNKTIDDDLTGYVSNIPKFSCRMGKKENRAAVKITGFAKKEDIDE